MNMQRLVKEFRDLQRQGMHKEGGEVMLRPSSEDNLNTWIAVIRGPPDTPYEGGRFKLKINVESSYPMNPPNIEFVTKIFHPNIHFGTGEICLDILKTKWTPAWTLESCMRAIIALLSHPEPDSPLNCDSGNLLRGGDTRGHDSMARMYRALYAESTEDQEE